MITKRMQVQAIADRLAGLPVRLKSRTGKIGFTEPWSICWEALENAQPGQEKMALIYALREYPNWGDIMNEVLAVDPGAPYGIYPSLLEMSAYLPEITWHWRGWIPYGMLSLMGAVPGAGKTYAALDLARRTINGDPFPDGQLCPRPDSNIVYVDAESIPQVINERCEAWEMDRSKIYLMGPEENDLMDFAKPFYQDKLIHMVLQYEPSMIVVDSLSSISSKGENNIEDIRQVLGFLNSVALETGAAMLLIHHLRKGSSRQMEMFDISIDDFRGSGHIMAMARSVMGISMVQTESKLDRNGPRKFEIIKTNLGPYPDALGYSFIPLHPTGVLLDWSKNAPEPYQEPTKLDSCVHWLEMLLRDADAPMRPAEIVELAESEGFSRSMLYRARDMLQANIENTRGRKDPANEWSWKEDSI